MKSSYRFSPAKKIVAQIAKPITNKVLELRNAHSGEGCYIFGDGISLKWFDLSDFSDKPAFSLNNFLFHNQSKLLNIRYAILTEPYCFYPYFRLPWPPKTLWRNRIQIKYRDLIKNNSDKSFFINLSNYPVLKSKNIYYLFRTINDSDFKFARECNLFGEEIYGGSFRCAIALAIFMGFKDIFLVGCDYTHENPKALHWYEKGCGKVLPAMEYEKSYLEIASSYASITTITKEGGGNVLPAMTYKQYTGKNPLFQENLLLADKANLDLLATWPGYNIF